MSTQTAVSPATVAQVEAALPYDAPGLRPRDVHERVGCWSRITTRAALRCLVEEGRATFDGPDGKRLYRRVRM